MLEFGEAKSHDVPIYEPGCHRCRFWSPVGDDSREIGLCRRSAPSGDGWPATGRHEWCGDFKMNSRTVLQRLLSLALILLGALYFLAVLVGSIPWSKR